MKDHLADLREGFVKGKELHQGFDGKFLDELVKSENARTPSLRLSHHAIDIGTVRRGGEAALESVSGLASMLIQGMARSKNWHAVLSIDHHHVAVSARHDSTHPSRVSLAVVDGLGSDITKAEWLQIAELLREHANRALAQAGKAPDAQVGISYLNPPILRTSTGAGSDVVALAAIRKMPADAGLRRLQGNVLDMLSRKAKPTAAGVHDSNAVLGAPLFKLMTRPQEMGELLSKRTELQTAKVNDKGQTLSEYQAAHMATRTPSFGTPSERNVAYEQKRQKLHERAIARLESRLAPGLEAMQAYLGGLQQARGNPATLPPAHDELFLDMLRGAENAKDPSLRLQAHRVEPALLAAGDPAATEGLWRSITEGMRTGKDWHATVDIEGHHVALSARHDAENPAHVSLVLMEGAGSPMQREDWQQLVGQLNDRMHTLTSANGGSGKVLMTHLDVSASQPKTDNSALFALMAAKDMSRVEGIGEIHADALARSRDPESPPMLSNKGDHLLDPDYTAVGGDPMTSHDIVDMQIEMYQQAVSHYEMILKEVT